MLRMFIIVWLLMVLPKMLLAQGQGGGVWLENGAYCVGGIIRDNYAKEGFGVAGENGVLLNSTIVNNKQLEDGVYFPKPGDVYCANGDIVDREVYAARAVKDAIGVVFWINGDPDCLYPKGAVVALDMQERKTWGDYTLSICGPETDEWGFEMPVDPSNFLKDTACYGNTRKMVAKWQSGNLTFEAGYLCWTYRAYYQINNPHTSTKDIRWCLPVLQYLRRMVVMVSEVEATFHVLRGTNPEIRCVDFDDSDGNTSNYWSSDDANTSGYDGWGWFVNFNTSRTNLIGKFNQNWVRPIFLY